MVGHGGNIFGAEFVPDRSCAVVTCSQDGTIRICRDIERGISSESLLHEAHNMMMRLQFVPHDPMRLVSLSAHGVVGSLDLRCEGRYTDLIKPEFGTAAMTTALAFNPSNTHQFALGSADSLIRVYDLRALDTRATSRLQHRVDRSDCVAKYCPSRSMLRARHNVYNDAGASGIAWNTAGELLATYREGDMYMFDTHKFTPEKEGICFTPTRTYKGQRNKRTFAKECCFFNADAYVCTGSDCGSLFVFDKATAAVVHKLTADGYSLVPCVPAARTGAACAAGSCWGRGGGRQRIDGRARCYLTL